MNSFNIKIKQSFCRVWVKQKRHLLFAVMSAFTLGLLGSAFYFYLNSEVSVYEVRFEVDENSKSSADLNNNLNHLVKWPGNIDDLFHIFERDLKGQSFQFDRLYVSLVKQVKSKGFQSNVFEAFETKEVRFNFSYLGFDQASFTYFIPGGEYEEKNIESFSKVFAESYNNFVSKYNVQKREEKVKIAKKDVRTFFNNLVDVRKKYIQSNEDQKEFLNLIGEVRDLKDPHIQNAKGNLRLNLKSTNLLLIQLIETKRKIKANQNSSLEKIERIENIIDRLLNLQNKVYINEQNEEFAIRLLVSQKTPVLFPFKMLNDDLPRLSNPSRAKVEKHFRYELEDVRTVVLSIYLIIIGSYVVFLKVNRIALIRGIRRIS